ncbi:TraR/DksA C4-type zinc finger protein [Candidatus Parcubacteria bacterium]|nr:TraR/DksA C4-type zinc finger protein [Candidatus Parcubacteria bacterium]
MTIDLEHFKTKLENEKKLLEKELEKVGRVNPDNPSDWEAKPSLEDKDTSQADENTVADSIEEYEDNKAILTTLETRYRDIKSGLDKIKHGVYGTCQVCGKEIEFDRLDANPSARTCKEHMNVA